MLKKQSIKEIKNVNTIGMFDLSKGLLMILIVLGHSIIEYFKYWEYELTVHWWYALLVPFRIFIYGLVPMFFMMSGYGFRVQSMKRCLRDRMKYLLKPYAYTGLIVLVLAVLKGIIKKESIALVLTQYGIPFLLGLCPGNTNIRDFYLGSIGPMWFLVVLALAWIVLNFVVKLEKRYLIWLCLATLTAFSVRLPFNAFIPFCIAQSFPCAFYIYTGYILKKERLLSKKWTKRESLVFWIVLLCVIPFGNVEVSQNVWKLGALDFVASVIAGVLLLKCCNYLNRWRGKIADFFCVLGRHSLDVLCIHSIEYLVFPWKRVINILTNNSISGVLCMLVMRMIFITVGCIIIAKVRKMKCR